MADSEEPRPELQQFLSERADALDRQAATIDAHEAEQRTLTHSLEPARRWIHTPAAVADSARRRPAVAAAVIAALLVGSVGGFAAGRSSAPARGNVAARGSARDSSTPSTVLSQGYAMATGGGMYPSVPVMTRLFLRTTADGVALRGYLQQMDKSMNGQPMCDPSSWCPPPECNPTTYFMAELSSTEAVAQNGSPQFPLDGPAAARGETQLGQMEGAPVSSYMVQTNSDVTNVRATWPDGFVDEMAPVNGWAMVAHSGATAPSTLEAVVTDGSSVALKNFQNGGGYSYPVQCQPPPPPPPELPPAGTEQPADVAASTDAVRTAYGTVFDHTTDPASRTQYIEDQPSIQSALDQTKKNFPQAADTVSVDIGEIRFLSGTDAALYFELKYDGGTMFGKQIGYAKLVDGTWKVSRDTMCMVLSWGGGQCDPPPDPARSTSAGNAPQPGTYSGPPPNMTASSTSSAAASDN
jgi:hypothetical protein